MIIGMCEGCIYTVNKYGVYKHGIAVKVFQGKGIHGRRNYLGMYADISGNFCYIWVHFDIKEVEFDIIIEQELGLEIKHCFGTLHMLSLRMITAEVCIFGFIPLAKYHG